ncbi:tripartite motif-containing protein 55-like [Saccostrea echinata]|uniref:tripartite motif-containing protein 55-like n=1 Tax=Saccostrea echinata TaxID=191078 RepID=UPI002A8063C8|nr:tripartite motif-containing protein 55-like [Saccostrea echinata]
MDLQRSAQKDIRCEHCETAVIQRHCELCHVNLCIACIGKHVSDDYDKHKVVPFKEQKSTLIFPKCITHRTKKCYLQCWKCNIPVCSLCPATKKHKKHTFFPLSEVYNQKKKFISNEKKELQDLSPTYKAIVNDVEKQISNLDGDYGKLADLVTNHGNEWHREIDRVTKKMKNEFYEMKSKHRCLLKNIWIKSNRYSLVLIESCVL